jgi:predicted PurR-regulated permease PerM/CheY-like chemotaxis protein
MTVLEENSAPRQVDLHIRSTEGNKLPENHPLVAGRIGRTVGKVNPFTIAATVLVIVAFYWAQAVLIPFALAILLTFLLSPLVTRIQQAGLGRGTSVTIVIALTFAVLAMIGWATVSQVTSLAEELPKYRQNIRQKVRDLRGMGKGGVLEQVQETVDEVKDEIEKGEASRAANNRRPIIVQAEPAVSWRSLYLGPLIQPIASATLVLGLLIFMLAQREDLRNRLIRLIGYAHLTVTTKALEEAGQRISRYLLMQITINGCFGIIISVALFLIGLPYAFLWGFLSVPLLFIPVIGFWTAAALPTIMSMGVFTDWWWPLLVVGLFLVLKTIINMLLEPLLYGRSVGVSPVPLLMMIAFWTWLWGPVGLLLATPLTVCLVVFAKNVPQLEFVEVLLSDEPPMEVQVSFYQRLLAMDQVEAVEILKQYLKRHKSEQVYDELLMPALSYAKEDRRRNNLSDHEELFLFKAMREIIEIAGTELQRSTLSEDGATASSVMDALPRIKIIGCPAHGEADEVALLMLRQLLESKNCSVEIVSSAALAAEVIARVREYNPDLLCISAVAPDGLVQVRYLSKRLRGSFPDISVVIGRWGLREFDENEDLPTDDLGKVGSTLLQTRDQITNLRQLISDADTKTRTEVFPASYD